MPSEKPWSEMNDEERNVIRLRRQGSKMGDCSDPGHPADRPKTNVVVVTFPPLDGRYVCLYCEREMIGWP